MLQVFKFSLIFASSTPNKLPYLKNKTKLLKYNTESCVLTFWF